MRNAHVGVALMSLVYFTAMDGVADTFTKKPKGIQRAWVFLTSKGKEMDRWLSERAMKRRRKASLREQPEPQDRPVSSLYVEQLQKRGLKVRTVSRWLNAVSVEGDHKTILKAAELPFVSRVESVPNQQIQNPVEKAAPVSIPPSTNVLMYGPSWQQLNRIGVLELQARGLSGKGVTIALLDSGFDRRHESFLKTKVRAEWDFVGNDNNVFEVGEEHGTQVWSLVGGYSPGRLIGAAYGATFLLARTENGSSESPLEEDLWISGLEWAEAQGADIVSSSVGYRAFDEASRNHSNQELNGQSLLISAAANEAARRGLLIINAIGNNGWNEELEQRVPCSLVAPADALGVLSVGATTLDDQVARFSSMGPTADGRMKPDVMAPGVRDLVATATGYGYAEGTSFAVPLVAGAAALLMEQHPDWSAMEIREALIQTAKSNEAPNNEHGYGQIDVAKASAYIPDRPIAAVFPTLH